jgi:glucoamylase
MPRGHTLRVETPARCLVRWSADRWTTANDIDSSDSGLGLWLADLPTVDLEDGRLVEFTFYWPDADRWEGSNFSVRVGSA